MELRALEHEVRLATTIDDSAMKVAMTRRFCLTEKVSSKLFRFLYMNTKQYKKVIFCIKAIINIIDINYLVKSADRYRIKRARNCIE